VEFAEGLTKAYTLNVPAPPVPSLIMAKYGPDGIGGYIKLLRKSVFYKDAARRKGPSSVC
jgi:hypothetical protein